MSHTPPPLSGDTWDFFWPILIGTAVGMLMAAILLPL